MGTQSNELVMSNEEIESAMSADDAPEPTSDTDSEGLAANDTDDGDIPSAWDQSDDEGDSDTEAKSATPATRNKSSQSVREYKANGKVHKVNLADQKSVDELVTLGLGARQVFTERDQLRKSLKAKEAEIADSKKYKDLWTKLEARKHDKEALYESIFGTKWSDDAIAHAKHQEAYEAATPEQRQFMDYKRQMDEDRKQREAEKREFEEYKKQVAEREHAANLKEAKSTLNPEFYKYEFSSKVKDPDVAAKMNKALWKLTISELREQFGDEQEIPPSAIRSAFKETHDMLWSNHKQVATEEVKKITEKKKTSSKEQAQIASTKNYGTGGKSLDALSKEKDPVKLWRKMFR